MNKEFKFVLCIIIVFGITIAAFGARNAHAGSGGTYCNQYGDSVICNDYSHMGEGDQ